MLGMFSVDYRKDFTILTQKKKKKRFYELSIVPNTKKKNLF